MEGRPLAFCPGLFGEEGKGEGRVSHGEADFVGLATVDPGKQVDAIGPDVERLDFDIGGFDIVEGDGLGGRPDSEITGKVEEIFDRDFQGAEDFDQLPFRPVHAEFDGSVRAGGNGVGGTSFGHRFEVDDRAVVRREVGIGGKVGTGQGDIINANHGGGTNARLEGGPLAVGTGTFGKEREGEGAVGKVEADFVGSPRLTPAKRSTPFAPMERASTSTWSAPTLLRVTVWVEDLTAKSPWR